MLTPFRGHLSSVIIDGHIDTELLRAKLDALTTKWPLLGGRLDVDEKVSLREKRRTRTSLDADAALASC